jgi:hypothetical protein
VLLAGINSIPDDGQSASIRNLDMAYEKVPRSEISGSRCRAPRNENVPEGFAEPT